MVPGAALVQVSVSADIVPSAMPFLERLVRPLHIAAMTLTSQGYVGVVRPAQPLTSLQPAGMYSASDPLIPGGSSVDMTAGAERKDDSDRIGKMVMEISKASIHVYPDSASDGYACEQTDWITFVVVSD